MAKLLTKIPENLTEYPNSFKRQGAFPLEAFSVQYSKAAAEDYAANNGVAYVGQTIAVVENGKVELFIIADAAGTLNPVGNTEATDAALAELAAYVGELPEGSTAETIVAYINEKTAGIATDTALKELQDDVAENTAAVATVDDRISIALQAAKDYADENDSDTIYDDTDVKASIKANSDAIAEEKTRAEAAEAKALSDAKAYTDEVKSAILGEGIEETFDTLVEIQKWIKESGVDATELTTAIAAETTARTEADNQINSTISALTETVGGKASAEHTHTAEDITDLDTLLAGKSDAGHGHAIDDVDGLQAALDGKANSEHTHTLANISDYDPSVFAAAEHTHAIEDVEGLQDALDGKEVSGAAASALTDAKEYTDEQITALNIGQYATNAYVGTIPANYTETNIVAYVNKKAEEVLTQASGGSSESAASVLAALNTYKAENDPKVAANTAAIGTLNTDVADIKTSIGEIEASIGAIVQPKASEEVTVAEDGTLGIGKISLDKVVTSETVVTISGGAANSF